MRSQFVSAATITLALVAPRLAHADVEINDDEQTVTIDCAKDPKISLNTSRSHITLTGECTEVSLNGASNELTVAIASLVGVNGEANKVVVDLIARIEINGEKNKVTWKKVSTPKKKKPAVSTNGNGNSVRKGK
jgi:hypothetical protein